MKTGIIILRPIGSEMNKVVIDQTFGTAELLLFGSAQMSEPFSTEQRTFKMILLVRSGFQPN